MADAPAARFIRRQAMAAAAAAVDRTSWQILLLMALASMAIAAAVPLSHGRRPSPTAPPALECTLDNFKQCIAGLYQSGGGNLAFPTTKDELELACTDLKDRVRCLDRHSERCFTREMLQVFGHIVTNAKQFVHDLCDDKMVQAEYLVHAKCFRNISLDEHKCGQEYREAVSWPVEAGATGIGSDVGLGDRSLLSLDDIMARQQLKEIIMRQSCCALQELVQCKRRHVREECGQPAAIFMRDHLPRITNPVLDQHCTAYTYGPNTCDKALYQYPSSGTIVLQRQHHNRPDHTGVSVPHASVSGRPPCIIVLLICIVIAIVFSIRK